MNATVESPITDDAARREGRRWRAIEVVALVLILALAAYFRLDPPKNGPNFDELWHLGLTAGRGNPLEYFPKDVLIESPIQQTATVGAPPFWHVWTGMDGVLHPPLYCFTLRIWRELFGDAERTARCYSIAWSLVAIVFQFATVRLAIGRAAALLGALAVAFAPTQVDLGQQIRAYAMLAALASIALWLMTRVEVLGSSRRRAVALAAMTLPMLLTHYFAFGAALCIAGYGLWRLVGHRKAFLGALVAAGAVYCVVWLPLAIQQIDDIKTGDDWLRAGDGNFVDVMLSLACAPFRVLVDRSQLEERMSVVMVVLYILPWVLARRLPALRPWALWLTVSLVSLAALDLLRSTRTITITRYLDIAAPAVVPLFIGIGAAIRPRLGIGAAALIAAFGGIYLASDARPQEGTLSFQRSVREVAKRIGPGDALLAYKGTGLPYLSEVVLMHASHEPGLFPRPIVHMTGPLPAEVARRLPRQAWLLAGPLDRPIEELVPGARLVWGRGVDRFVMLYQLEIAGDATGPATAPAAPSPASP